MNVQKLAADMIPLLGGKENIRIAQHCMTRLRFTLADKSKADLKKVEALEGVMGVKEVGTQTQIIIGPDVAHVFKEVTALTGPLDNAPAASEEKEKGTLGARLLDMITGIFAPVVPLITGAGMVKAILTILVLFGLSNKSNEYYILNFIADCGFYFFPIVLAFSSATKFGCNPYLAAMIGGVLIHPNWNALVAAGEAVSFFGIPVKLFSYGSSILPTILIVWFMSYVERFADRVSPKMVKAILKPLITMAVTSLVGLIALAPLGAYIGGLLASVISFLDSSVPILVPTIVGIIQPFLIFFGMHLAIFPPLQTLQMAEMGYETVCGPGFLAAVLATAGATVGFGVATKNKQAKELAFSTGFTACCGVTEPAVYGIIVKYKQIIPAVMTGGMVGGLFAGVFHLKRYAFAAPGIPALPTFIGEDPNNIFIAIATVCIAFAVSFAVSYLITRRTEQKSTTPAVPSPQPNTLYLPLDGRLIPLEQVPDETFASGVLGQGFAVEPTSNKVYAPFDGTIASIADSKHAIGLESADGMQVLIHVGIDTVDMNGKGFILHCKEDDTVKCGQLLMEFDTKAIRSAGHPATTVVLVTNAEDFQQITMDSPQKGTALEKVLSVC